MENYYQLLGVTQTVSQTELETVWEDKYNEVRRLVTHHEPAVVEDANRTMRMLENARNILFDPEKRAEYTERLFGQGVSGLSDPTATPAPGIKTPPSPGMQIGGQPAQPAAPAPQRLDAWICPECQRENALGTQYCASCGNKIAKACPVCDTLDYLGNNFCPNCGANKEEAFQQNIQAQIKVIQNKINAAESEIQLYKRAADSFLSMDEDIREVNKMYAPTGCLPTFLGIMILVGGLILTINSFVNDYGPLGLVVSIVAAVLIVEGFNKLSRDKDLKRHINSTRDSIQTYKQEIKELEQQAYF